jgi:2-methylcitrate dehydratase PrpD
MDATYLFAENFVKTRYDDLPRDVVEATKKEILDMLGVIVGGFSEPGVKELYEIVTEWGGKEESSIIGSRQKVPAPNAAHVNATMAHALDYDDVHESAVMHPGIAIIPTGLAMGERKGRLNGREFITCTALGVDMMCRLALATTPGRTPIKTGWHLTTLYGFLGAAGAAGKIMELDHERMINAMGIAYHQCSGNGQCVKDGALTKRLGPGFAVKGGITAAIMAEKGITGAKNCLEGEMGLYNIYMRGDYDPGILTKDLGKFFEGINVAIKPYPCCRGIHPAIDSGLALLKERDVRTENIDEIKIFVSEDHHFLLCTPEDAKRRPRNPVDAQFSIPWGVATVIVRNRVNLADFTEEAIRSTEILEVVEKIKVEVDNTLKRTDKVDPTRVQVTMKNGEIYSEQIEDTLGSLQKPMSFDDCAVKFRDCAKLLEEEKTNRVIELIGKLDEVEDVGEIIGLLTDK